MYYCISKLYIISLQLLFVWPSVYRVISIQHALTLTVSKRVKFSGRVTLVNTCTILIWHVLSQAISCLYDSDVTDRFGAILWYLFVQTKDTRFRSLIRLHCLPHRHNADICDKFYPKINGSLWVRNGNSTYCPISIFSHTFLHVHFGITFCDHFGSISSAIREFIGNISQ